ncbi:UPF0739 protein C1orf74 homolog [Thalassophryne amazonica]|uniref:UPF0739 protein C1orf74 homolog n=1 Tax=Thalassophryne amazonica TaxID=390379 RepID=UPI001470C71B|nr:UPF0739 protein C1orf74 homolog [Thalassophryne amazonica]
MSTRELFVSAACKCLSTGKKPLSVPVSLDLAAQVLAVDLGVKPALLYDSNGASAEQVQQYLRSLQSSGLVSKSLLTLDLNGNALIMNPFTTISNLKQLLNGNSVAVIDVGHSLEKPTIVDQLREELKTIAEEVLFILAEFGQLEESDKPLSVGEKSETWNLCTVFGTLLDYPVTYWFDQNKSFENCLAMMPLMVTTASATWRENYASGRCCLYSFSIPAVLLNETQAKLENWKLHLHERFQQQTVLTDLTVSQSTVTLPSVCL